jgi:hypothetical protein
MSREAQAVVHLRRFANAVSIAIAVPQDRKSGVRTLRDLLTGIAQTIGNEANSVGGTATLPTEALARDPIAATPVQSATDDKALARGLSGSVAALTPTVDVISIDGAKATHAASDDTNRFPTNTTGNSVLPETLAQKSAVATPRSALTSVPTAAASTTAHSFFGGISWETSEGVAQEKPLAAQAQVATVVANGTAEHTTASPMRSPAVSGSATGFFGNVNWEASDMNTPEPKASTAAKVSTSAPSAPESASGFFGGVNWEASQDNVNASRAESISIQPSPGAAALTEQFNKLPGIATSPAPSPVQAQTQSSSDFFKQMPWDTADSTDAAESASHKKES